MPVISTLGAMSSRGFGEFNQQAQGQYIENYFSTYLYTGTGSAQTINNGIAIGDSSVFSNTSSTALPSAASRFWTTISFGNGYFLAANYKGASPFTSNTLAYSTDGITWTSNTSIPSSTWVGSAYGNGVYVIVSSYISGFNNSSAAYSSTVNGTFTAASGFPSTIVTNNVRWVNDRFIATAQGGTTMAYSTNGSSWTSITVPSGSWYDVAYGNGKWVCVQQSNGQCMTSTNGTTWTQAGTSLSNGAYSIAFGNGVFVTNGASNAYTSTDGVTWTDVTSTTPMLNGYQIIFDGTYFVMASSTTAPQAGIAYSSNGVNWTFRPAPTSTFNGDGQAFIAYGNSTYAIVSRGTGNYSATINSLVPTTIGSGGLVWMKSRSAATDNALYDTARGVTKDLASNTLAAQTTQATGLTSFTSSGFSIGALAKINTNSALYTSWTFRKQPKFFDVVTYTGNGANRTIAHNLGSVPGMIIIKRTDTTSDWAVYHSALANTEYLVLNTTAAKATGATYWNSTTPTSTVFSLGTSTDVNANGGTYVAYLYASNAGGFGADGSQNVISCGSYTGNGSTIGPTITLGWEPQFLLVKGSTEATANWIIFDNVRGLPVGANGQQLLPNSSGAEGSADRFSITATGFNPINGYSQSNASGQTYIYMAIRRGPMRTPTSGTSVFSPITSATGTGAKLTTNFVVDSQWTAKRGTTDALNTAVDDRLRGVSTTATASGNYLVTSTISSESTASAITRAWDNTGFQIPAYYTGINTIYWNFARAPNFMDIVCYTGNGAVTTINHNLGAIPELMIIKSRSSSSYSWSIYSAPTGNGNWMQFDAYGAFPNSGFWNNTSPTSSVFTVGTVSYVNNSGTTYVAYLFASCPNVSKIGSYTGTGSTQTINCGFSGGARFVLIKRTDDISSGNNPWYVWDTARGMVSGTDPSILWNTNSAEVNANSVYTTTGGFQVVSTVAGLNASGGTYIYLAIA